MQLDFNTQLKTLSFQPKTEETVGKILSSILASETGPGTKDKALKLWAWAESLDHDEPLNLDLADANYLRTLVDTADRCQVLAKAQILQVIDSAKDELVRLEKEAREKPVQITRVD